MSRTTGKAPKPAKSSAPSRLRSDEWSESMSHPVSIEGTSNATQGVVNPARHPLDYIFTPKSVAVIGATEAAGSVGRTVLSNLLKSPFGGPVYPVNPKRRSVLGVPCWPDE